MMLSAIKRYSTSLASSRVVGFVADDESGAVGAWHCVHDAAPTFAWGA